jgi:transposase-like protein
MAEHGKCGRTATIDTRISRKGPCTMAGKRKQYTPEFKLKVVLESLQRDTTIEEVCRKFEVSSSMVSRWRQAFQ